MPKRLDMEDVDIYKRPATKVIEGETQVSIGDLHSNAIKLLFVLQRHGIVDISAENYYNLVAIYTKPCCYLTQDDMARFKKIIDQIPVINRNMLVRLIGDETADRGQNDYFTLKILEKLHQEKVPVTILLSNHGVEFVEAYERYIEQNKKFKSTMLNHFAMSLIIMQSLIERGLIDGEEVIELANARYKPMLKALDYSLSADGSEITLFSHAGIDLLIVQCLAEKLGTVYNDATAADLAASIDAINAVFSIHVQNNSVHTLYDRSSISQGGHGGSPIDKTEHPLEFIMWNRFYEKTLAREETLRPYRINYVHGHDRGDLSRNNIYNLDNILGKMSWVNTGTYTALVSDDPQSAVALDAVISDNTTTATSSSLITSDSQPNPGPVTLLQEGGAGAREPGMYSFSLLKGIRKSSPAPRSLSGSEHSDSLPASSQSEDIGLRL